jgi:branched-chain amino acid transport system ATP-binding protein
VKTALLEGAEVSKRFGGLQVLRQVDFAVAPGEIVALIGPNGAGKTTLFNLVSGLLRPSRGQIRLAGRDITALPPYRISRLGVGRTFQTPRPFLNLTTGENVRAAALFAERPAPPPEECLRTVGLAGHVPARHLPAGLRKLLELAMALATGPRVLLLDEILSGLTPPEVERAVPLLRRIRDASGAALFWIEHIMQPLMATAERVIVLHHGEVIAQGPPQAVAADPQVLEAYLGEPITT